MEEPKAMAALRPHVLGLAAAAGVCLPLALAGQEETLDVLDGETLYEGGRLATLTFEVEHRERLRSGEGRASDPLHRRRTDLTWAAAAHYGLRNDLQLSAILPYVYKELRLDDPAGPDDLQGDGFGDLSTIAKWRFYRWDAPGQAINAASIAGLEWPTGADELSDHGRRLEPELQPGSGSFDPFAGLAATYEPFRWRFNAFVLYKYNSENGDDHDFGDEVFAEIAAGNRFWLLPYPGPFMRGDVMLRYRGEERARQDGRVVHDSGSDLVTIGANWAFRPRPSLDFQLSGELPIYQRYDGEQLGREFSLSFSFGYRF
jgi:hypothetical protein